MMGRIVKIVVFGATGVIGRAVTTELLVRGHTVTAATRTCVSPARVTGPGERTGQFRVGGDRLLVDESGESRISISDFAIAFADELEHGAAFRRRITAAY
jgi:putative NADH-flavin reductase